MDPALWEVQCLACTHAGKFHTSVSDACVVAECRCRSYVPWELPTDKLATNADYRETRMRAAVEGAMTAVVHGAVASTADMLDALAEGIGAEMTELNTGHDVLSFVAGVRFAASAVRLANV